MKNNIMSDALIIVFKVKKQKDARLYLVDDAIKLNYANADFDKGILAEVRNKKMSW